MARPKPRSPKLVRRHPLARGLVGAWPFYEGGGGTLNDLSGNQNNSDGLSASPPVWAGGQFGSALKFNQSAIQYVKIPSSTSLNPSAITVCAWVSPTGGAGNYRTVLVKRADSDGTTWGSPYARYAMRLNSSNQLECWINDGGVVANYATTGALSWAASADGSWHFLCMTYDGAVLRVYVDGALSVFTTINSALLSSSFHVYIGSDNSISTESWIGLIDAVSIHNRALSASEIVQLYFDPFAIYRPERRVPWFTVAASGATSYSFPTKGWVWNHQAPTLAFANAVAQKSWVWHPQPPTQAFAVAAAQKAWRWNAQAPGLNLTPAIPRKAWAWAANAPALAQAIAAARKVWLWAAQSPTVTGGNIITTFTVRMLGPIWKRRRSRPPL